MSDISKIYSDAVTTLIETIEKSEKRALQDAAQVLATKIAEGRLVHVIGPGGHSNMAVEEVLWRAGGLAPINGILDPGTNLIHGAKRSNIVERTPGYARAVLDAYRVGSGDVLVIVNAYGINSMTIDCALECKKRGATSVAITSTSFADSVPLTAASRHPEGLNLYEIADIFINNHLPLGDAVVEIPGLKQKMGPLASFANIFAINLLMMKTAEKLLGMGIQPPVWTSANLPEGDGLNKAYEEKYATGAKHLR